ncbi:DUF983 domain-containing protein [Consotaella aegiceratis]|uniref:DUF983 domain-containing protein n=1 Tax=Consotaella aegiceratis TaxID=3097961 RepID=UPI002F4216A7
MDDRNPTTAVFGASPAARPIWPALANGWRCRCPRCGEGKLFAGYLTTVHECSVCGKEIHHHRADDMPPYLTILIVGHVVVGLFMTADDLFGWSLLVHSIVWPLVTLAMCLALLRPLKGATIGLQWAMRMHGFGGDEPAPSDELG